jgi:hypothetical protein
MFLTAVLQAHTDSLPPSGDAGATRETRETVTIPARLQEALTLPARERLQPLPSVHRSRWL